MKEGRSRSSRYHAYCDDYYVNMNLNTEMELPQTRETVLHFFEQVKKNYPGDAEFLQPRAGRVRAGGGQGQGRLSLDEHRDRGGFRSGYVNPPIGRGGDEAARPGARHDSVRACRSARSIASR